MTAGLRPALGSGYDDLTRLRLWVQMHLGLLLGHSITPLYPDYHYISALTNGRIFVSSTNELRGSSR